MSATQHHDHHHDIRVPKEALIAAGLLISLTIVTVFAFRIGGLEPAAQVSAGASTVESMALRFEDGDRGTVRVYELSEDAGEHLVHVVPSGEGGFVRGVLRSFARARRARGIGADLPFLLKLQASGTLVLEDPQTDQQIDLQAYGPTNIGAFRAMLVEQEPER